jgi:N-acetylmuramoyl-L-alanine amidase
MIFRWLRSLFGGRDREPQFPPTEPVKLPAEKPEKLRVLILPGHQRGAGARSYQPHIEESEWNREVVANIEMKYNGKHQLVRGCDWRTEKSYSAYCRRIKKWCKANKIDLCIEVHLNAAGVPEARGCEMLVAPKDATAFNAFTLISMFSVRFKIVPRGIYKTFQGVRARTYNHRGGKFLNDLESVGTQAMIFEPFFCDYKSRESEQFLEEPDYGVKKVSDFFVKALDYL